MHLSYFVLVSAVFPFRLPEEENRTGLVKAPYETGKTAKGKKMTDKEICGMAEDILETLRKPSDKIENVPPIPNEVSVQKCELRGSILDIDINKAYL